MSEQSPKLVIFFSGGCPLCVKEMHHLRKLDEQRKIQFENINEPDFNQRYFVVAPNLSRA